MHAPPRRKRNSTKVNLFVSLVFHSLVIGALFFFAAREGMLGQKLKTIAVQMAPKEKPPEKKPEEKKPEEPKPEPPKVVEKPKVTPPPKVVEAPKATAPKVIDAPKITAVAPPPAMIAPPAVDVGSFNFKDDSAKTVQSSSDPVMIYKGFVEYALRSKWTRPSGVDDANFVAEVDVTIDPAGKITDTNWRNGSGDTRWDDSVKRALKDTPALTRPPPKNFPARVLVRFDTQQESEPITAFGQP
jgi:outer membrane biosynthesis protein TonB